MPSLDGPLVVPQGYLGHDSSNIWFQHFLPRKKLVFPARGDMSLTFDCKMVLVLRLSKSRLRMRLVMTKQSVDKSWSCRTITAEDTEALAKLMLAAYQGTIDYDGETLEDARREVKGAFQGKVGTFQELSSFAIEEEGRFLSAIIITLWQERPLVAYSMTHPEFKNRGMATFLLKSAINALLTFNYKELYLMVTDGNEPAQHIYEKVGFRPE